MKKKFIGEVHFGRLQLYDEQEFKDLVKTYEDKRVILTIQSFKKNRSNPENRYYWGVVVEILADEFGYTKDEMHEILKAKFLTEKIMLTTQTNTIEAVDRVRSSATLTTQAFEKYLSEIRQWASIEHHIYIPEPNEVDVPTYY